MNIMFVNEPQINVKKWLEDNNCNYIKYGMENPMDVDVIYTHENIKFKNYPTLQYILCPMTGVAHLKNVSKYKLYYLDDPKFLFKHAWSTAEHTVALILRLHRGLFKELRGKIIGIVGLGRVGQQVYKLLSTWDCKFLYYDPNKDLINFKKHVSLGDNIEFTSLENVFIKSDVITIHIPENNLTKQLINTKLLNMCERQPFLINTSRASLINWSNLITAFENGKICGFGMDIDFDYLKSDTSESIYEKLRDLNKLYAGVILTNHIAGKGFESRCNTDLHVFNRFFEDLGGKMDENYFGCVL